MENSYNFVKSLYEKNEKSCSGCQNNIRQLVSFCLSLRGQEIYSLLGTSLSYTQLCEIPVLYKSLIKIMPTFALFSKVNH